ncbi:MAG: 16S rRNA (cytidine(1402)-2'-O)-methyltransferase [Gemmatimonadota bacterium]
MERKPFWDNDPLIAASGVADQDMPAGTLYVVATPIGNAADVTLRALWVLSQMNAIACEDTRTTRPLLARYRIATPLLAVHQHNERAAVETIGRRLARGERIALVTDAGTPAVSDPGARLVRALRDAGHRIVPVPGASSVTGAISAAGLTEAPWIFVGFLPRAARERAQMLRAAAAGGHAVVILEAPHRIGATAREIGAAFDPMRRVVVARELTKKFETIEATTVGALAAAVERTEARGEYVLLIDAVSAAATQAIDPVALRWLHALMDEMPASRAAALAARVTGLPRALLYDAAIGKSRD